MPGWPGDSTRARVRTDHQLTTKPGKANTKRDARSPYYTIKHTGTPHNHGVASWGFYCKYNTEVINLQS